MIRMQIAGISVDPESGGAILLLQERGGRSLPICIGLPEATAIAKELEGIRLPRPLTHDLLRSVLEQLGGRLTRVEIIDLRDNTYFAELVVALAAGGEKRIDSRPSDAIALAVRTRSPICVDPGVLDTAGVVDAELEEAAGSAEAEDSEAESSVVSLPSTPEDWQRLLEQMEPEDFGKYKQ